MQPKNLYTNDHQVFYVLEEVTTTYKRKYNTGDLTDKDNAANQIYTAKHIGKFREDNTIMAFDFKIIFEDDLYIPLTKYTYRQKTSEEFKAELANKTCS